MSNNFALMLRVRGAVSVDQLETALRQVRVRHPALAPDPAGVFIVLEQTGCGDDDWIAVAQGELRNAFPEQGGPFARFTLLQRPAGDAAGPGFDLLAAFHHGRCDGMSGVFVLRDLLQALADPQATLVPLPAPPPTASLVPAAIRTNRAVQRRVDLEVAGLRGRIWLQKLQRRLIPHKPADALPGQSISDGELPLEQQYGILPARLMTAQTAALLARCKSEQVSVHAVVCAAWLKAQTAVTGVRFGTVSSPVNLRARLSPPPGETSGLFLAIVETRLDCAPERDVWQLARAFKQAFERDTRDEVLFLKPLLYGKVFSQLPPDERGMAAELLFNSPVAYDFSITNLGRLAIPERSGALRTEAFYGPLVNSSEYERTIGVSTLGAQMSITYLFRKSQTDPAQAAEVMQRALQLLLI